jgi:hypothetical protein
LSWHEPILGAKTWHQPKVPKVGGQKQCAAHDGDTCDLQILSRNSDLSSAHPGKFVGGRIEWRDGPVS